MERRQVTTKSHYEIGLILGFSLDKLDKLLTSSSGMVFWRHDVDYSLDAALEMGEFEAERGIRATYYLFFDGTCPFYHTYDAWNTASKLRQLGHHIGEHIDERKVDLGRIQGGKRRKISFHCPTEAVLWRDFSNFQSAYRPIWKDRYFADSNGRDDRIPQSVKRHAQVNLHPEWWFSPGWYHGIPDDVYEEFFYAKKPNFVDSRRGRAVLPGGNAIWAFDPRPWSPHCALWVSPEDYEAVISRGYAVIDGQKAVPFLQACDEPLGFLRLVFQDGNYVLPEGREEVHDVRLMKGA